MLIFDTLPDALRFQKRLVTLMRRKDVVGKVRIKRFHFTAIPYGRAGGFEDISAAVEEKSKPISSVLVKAAKAGK